MNLIGFVLTQISIYFYTTVIWVSFFVRFCQSIFQHSYSKYTIHKYCSRIYILMKTLIPSSVFITGEFGFWFTHKLQIEKHNAKEFKINFNSTSLDQFFHSQNGKFQLKPIQKIPNMVPFSTIFIFYFFWGVGGLHSFHSYGVKFFHNMQSTVICFKW